MLVCLSVRVRMSNTIAPIFLHNNYYPGGLVLLYDDTYRDLDSIMIKGFYTIVRADKLYHSYYILALTIPSKYVMMSDVRYNKNVL